MGRVGEDAAQLQLNEVVEVLINPGASEDDVRSGVLQISRINLSDLERSLAAHPAMYAYVAVAYELAKVQEASEKYTLERVEAQAFVALGEADAKKAVSAREKEVALDPAVLAQRERHRRTQVVTGRLRALATALEHRRDMLIQISARQRQEMQT